MMAKKVKKRNPQIGDMYKGWDEIYLLVGCEYKDEDNTDMFRCKNLTRETKDIHIHYITIKQIWEYIA